MPSSIATSDLDALQRVPPSTRAITQRASRAPRGRGVTRGASRFVVGLAVGVIGITASSAVTLAQELTLPPVTGPAMVGRIELALTDAGRPDPFVTDGRARELAVWIWYPAVEGSSGAAAPYLPSTWADLVNSAAILSQDRNAVVTNAIAGAPLDGEPPAVVLMPGLGSRSRRIRRWPRTWPATATRSSASTRPAPVSWCSPTAMWSLRPPWVGSILRC